VLELCTARDRRGFLKVASLGLGGLALPDVLRARAENSAASRDTAVILIFLSRGPAQLETFDPKPDAPEEVRGPFASNQTAVPGVRVTELFPEIARRMDLLSVLRALHHTTGSHHHCYHWMMTGTHPDNLQFGVNHRPAVGAVAACFPGPNSAGMPAYAGMPSATGYCGPAYLGPRDAPFVVTDPTDAKFQVPSSHPQAGRGHGRRETGGARRSAARVRHDAPRPRRARQRRGTRRVPARGARPHARPDRAHRVRPDPRRRAPARPLRPNPYRPVLPMARRLVEAGVTFVAYEDYETFKWDLHGPAGNDPFGVKKGTPLNGRHLDRALSAMLDDLDARGMRKHARRRHRRVRAHVEGQPRRRARPHLFVFSALLAGGGLNHGRAVGASTASADRQRERPTTPGDLLATIYHVLGIDRATARPRPRTRPAARSLS